MLDNATPPHFRGVFEALEDPAYWREAVEKFPNKVPRFLSKEDYIDFMNRIGYKHTNPEEPKLYHSISLLTSWSQINKYLAPKISEYNSRWDPLHPECIDVSSNRFMVSKDVASDVAEGRSLLAHDYLLSRLNLSIHKTLSPISTENTLNYLFHHMRCGIFGMIRNNALVIFCPFVNKNYKNKWGTLQLNCPENTVDNYYSIKEKFTGPENYLSDMSQWWANGNIICNQHQRQWEKADETQWWGDNFNFQLKDMIAETCRTRQVPDCDFFLNKRDYPQIKFHCETSSPEPGVTAGLAVEPYGFIFDRDDRDANQDIPLSDHAYKTYAPVLSFYTSSRFADIPFPSTEDWESATGEMFINSMIPGEVKPSELAPELPKPRDYFTESNFRKFERIWSEKKDTAFFRGTATGGGTTVDTNQRLHLALLSHLWDQDAKGQIGSYPDDYVPYLDAKITGWNNRRDRKIAGEKMTFLRTASFPFEGGKQNFTPIYEQGTYKYLIYAEGHCAACRYGFMMRLGSVILKVESMCVADQMWYFPLLKPYYDHVPVKADLSDLKERIEWCRSHDAECKVIAENAKLLYEKYVSREGIMDYMQMVFYEIASRTVRKPIFARQQELPLPPFSLAAPKEELMNFCCQVNGDMRICVTCANRKKVGLKRTLEASNEDENKSRLKPDKRAGYRKKKE